MQINPIVEKELKVKMRGWRAPALISVYAGFLGLVIFLFFLANNLLSKYTIDYFNPRIAVTAYYTVASFQLGLILFITPAITGSSISGERERQTLDLLLCTHFSPLRIVMGKAIASIAHIILLITASLPIMGMILAFGGIRVQDLLLLFAFYTVTALMVSGMGIFYSTLFKRSLMATVMTYITLLVFMFGTLVAIAFYGIFMYEAGNAPSGAPSYGEIMAFLFSNPIVGFVSVLDGMEGGGWVYQILRSFSRTISANSGRAVFQPWVINVTFDLLAFAAFILLAARTIRPVPARLSKKEKKAS